MKPRVFDAHCDTAFELWHRGENLKENSCHISLRHAEHLAAYAQIFAFCSLAGCPGVEESTYADLLHKPLALLRRQVEEHKERIAFALHADRITRLNEQGKIAALLSIEGPELIGCDPERLAELRTEGFVMSTLTWNADNALAGCHSSDLGLSDRGRAYVAAAQELGIYVDVSHLSERAFHDLAEISQKPIVASHSNCRALWDHSRNLTDVQLRLIGESGGVVGLNLYVPFLGETADLYTMQRHLEHMLRHCGETHVCIGGDLDGCEVLPQGMNSLADYGKFYEHLRRQGYDEALLDRIFYRNLLELF